MYIRTKFVQKSVLLTLETAERWIIAGNDAEVKNECDIFSF